MKTVLHILRLNGFSGAENVVITLIKAFPQYGKTNYRFIYTAPDGPIREILLENGVDFAPMRRFSRSEVKRVIEETKPDIIHAHDYMASIVASNLARKTPVISHIHSNSPWIKTLCAKSLAYGLSCFRYQKILGVSPSVFDEFIFGKWFKNKEMIIGNPIDIENTRRKSCLAAATDSYDVVFLGRLTPPKDPIRFIQCMKMVCSERPQTKAVMIGDGELRESVEKKISELSLQEHVHCIGFVKNPYGILKASKLLCMTSLWEGYGLVAVEALSLGKPVVATPVGGIPTIITGKEGSLCQTNQEICDEIIHLLDDGIYYSEKSEAALKRAAEIDNLKAYVMTIDNVYSCVKEDQ